MRIFSGLIFILPLALVACGGGPETEPAPKTEKEVAARAEDNQQVIACAIDGAPMAKMCTYETANGEQGLTVIVRHPDAGFRRLLITKDGNVVSADGADGASFVMLGTDQIEVTLAGDKYQLPAQMKPPA